MSFLRSLGRVVLGVVGVCLLLLGLFLAIAAAGDAIEGRTADASRGVLVGLVVFSAALAVLGAMLAKREFWSSRKKTTGFDEGAVLALAEQRDRRLTVDEVAAEFDSTHERAKAKLDGLVQEGLAEMEATQAGVLVYSFKGLLTAEEKLAARDL